MDGLSEQLDALVGRTYVQQGLQSIASRHKLFKALLSSRELPSTGWDELSIELLLAELAAMDSNNFPGNIGAGEREGRVYCSLVARRHFRMSHGVGRSGNIAEVQPKSAGSSIVSKLTAVLLSSALRVCGLAMVKQLVVLPLATGMSLMMCMSALRTTRLTAKYVIFPRIDQKSCFKSMLSANLLPLVVPGVLVGDEIVTDVHAVEALMQLHGDEVLCVLSTTSCFAPRAPDAVDVIAVLCQKYSTAHVINHAYGVQCSSLNKLVNRAMTIGRVDFLVASLDKNFMVPVGGAFVASQLPSNVELVSQLYPGRASASPTLDLFVTLLAMGKRDLTRLLAAREALVETLRNVLLELADRHGERLLATPSNPISMALSLERLDEAGVAVTFVGSMMFQRCISGTRVVPRAAVNTIGAHTFAGWGAHVDDYPCAYLTAACAIGMTEEEVLEFVAKLGRVFVQCKAKRFDAASALV